ncbi:MAG: hypothetical protein AB1384_12630 [Actinomycetota bacterium]
MRKIFTACVLVLVVMALSLSLALAQTDQEVINEVFTETESIRGLQANPGIQVNYLDREQLEQRMLDDFAEENPEEEIDDAERIMVMLGFIEPDLDLEDFYIALLTEQVAGFYDPEDDGLYLISESQSMSAMDQYTLSHEFVHYLQDQNFDLMRPPFHDPDDAEVETDDDASFAATCLVEGDAMLASENWLMKYMDPEDMLDMQSESGDYSTEVLDSAPPYIYESLLFPYIEGAEFVNYVYDEGGWDAIDRAYSDPPSTTEQIYHPEKYLKGEKAVEVKLEDISEQLGDGWNLDYENVLGEFDVYQLFSPYFMDTDDVEAAAAGWGGNKYQYYSNGEGDELLLQKYAWDSEKDAQEFASAYTQYLEDRFGDEVKKEASRGAWTVWSTDEYEIGIKRDGKDICVVQANVDEPLETAISSLGEAGDTIDEGALKAETGEGDEETDLTWLIIALVVGLLVLGIILVIVMLIMYRRPPAPPAQPPAGNTGPYYSPPGSIPPPPPSQVPPPPGAVPSDATPPPATPVEPSE